MNKCPKCNKEISDKSKECPHCGCPTCESLKMKDLVFSNYDYKCKNCSETKYTQIENQGGIFLVCDKCGYVDEVIPRQQIQQQNIPKCPKCGSTAIQMVPRKFSLLTGFATNKVDRVCVNCKYKW